MDSTKAHAIAAKFCNACIGSSRPQIRFDAAEPENTDAFVRIKHSKDFDKFKKEFLEDGRILYTYRNSRNLIIVKKAAEFPSLSL